MSALFVAKADFRRAWEHYRAASEQKSN